MDYKVSKGNIPIDKNKLNKYKSVREIFDNEQDSDEIVINNKIKEIENIDINKLDNSNLKKLAKDLFIKYNKKSFYYNGKNKIFVSKSCIDECITKIKKIPDQNRLLKEHLIIISNLGLIIENVKLVNQCLEYKNRLKYNYWNYYFGKILIDSQYYLVEITVASMDSGENHYRVQSIKKIDISHGDVSK